MGKEHITMKFPNDTEVRIIGDAEVILQIIKRLSGFEVVTTNQKEE